MNESGWIKVHRSIRDNAIWASSEPFDKRSAWIDLLISANYADGEMLSGGQVVNVPRGSFITSESALMSRWRWSKNKIRTFLKLLQSENMIEINACKKWTRINIVNYSVFQDSQTTKEPQRDHKRTTKEPQRDHKRTTKEPQKDHRETTKEPPKVHDIRNKEYKEEKEIKKGRKKEEVIVSVSKDTDCQTQDVRLVIEQWNLLESYGIAPVSKISPNTQRCKCLIARIKEYGVADVMTAISNIKESDFLLGKNKKGWTITFDWFVKPNNFPKVLENNYKNKNSEQRTVYDEWREA